MNSEATFLATAKYQPSYVKAISSRTSQETKCHDVIKKVFQTDFFLVIMNSESPFLATVIYQPSYVKAIPSRNRQETKCHDVIKRFFTLNLFLGIMDSEATILATAKYQPSYLKDLRRSLPGPARKLNVMMLSKRFFKLKLFLGIMNIVNQRFWLQLYTKHFPGTGI